MQRYLLTGTFSAPPSSIAEAVEREWALYKSAFRGASAWMGSLKLVIFESDRDERDLMGEFSSFITQDEFLMLMNLTSGHVYYSGCLVDAENFHTMFPDAVSFDLQ